MKQYQNRSGDSGVIAYEIGSDFIKVQFREGRTYLYTYTSAGRDNIKMMKHLAADGQGLSTFISTTVKDRYAGRLF